MPSILNVFHKQSNGFLYKAPLSFPSGPTTVGWLYIRVRAVSAGCMARHWAAEHEDLRDNQNSENTYHTRARHSTTQQKRPGAIRRQDVVFHYL